MTYARKMAHKAQDGWLNGPGGHAHALEVVEAVVSEVIERCAQEADPACDCESTPPRHDECKGARDAMRRIRALAAPPAGVGAEPKAQS